jgi:hypothetical protein
MRVKDGREVLEGKGKYRLNLEISGRAHDWFCSLLATASKTAQGPADVAYTTIHFHQK